MCFPHLKKQTKHPLAFFRVFSTKVALSPNLTSLLSCYQCCLVSVLFSCLAKTCTVAEACTMRVFIILGKNNFYSQTYHEVVCAVKVFIMDLEFLEVLGSLNLINITASSVSLQTLFSLVTLGACAEQNQEMGS